MNKPPLLATVVLCALLTSLASVVFLPTPARTETSQKIDGFNVTSVDGHPLAGSLADTVYDGYLPRDICHQSIVEAEKQMDIPKDLLMAIALTEAGRWQSDSRQALIWPWSVTVGGKGHFYETPELAINATETFLAHGIKNIDIGCMQVNAEYHQHAFNSIAEMFDPIYNTAYAASFLLTLKNDLGTWSLAVEGYHSRTPKIGVSYGKKVMTRWKEITQQRRKEHQENIALQNKEQRERQQQEQALQAQKRAKKEEELEARKKSIEGTQAGEWKRSTTYKRQQQQEVTARARVLSPQLPSVPSLQHPAENEKIIYHTLEDNQRINTSEQWLLQKLEELEHPSSDNQSSDSNAPVNRLP